MVTKSLARKSLKDYQGCHKGGCKMLAPKNPCTCKPPKRNGTCHGTCAEYKAYIKLLDEYNAIVKANKDIYYSNEEMSITTLHRNRQRKRR